ncbi:uncharacterized protein LOC127000127 [Eriocheir sinensis]|uniref:uncharacterized protein LOC127000127 n=1 Tax=Eriocheir sinensis TaxID=95602 RepID=UPI0021C8F41E|nr:uncharacterized protein LOC127000127 [Eriocheir sinensis]
MYLLEPRYRSQFIAPWDEAGQIAAYMNMAGDLGLYTGQQEWLVLLPQNATLQKIKSALANVKLFVDSEVMLCQESPNGRYEILQVWNVGKEAGDHTLQEELWATWSPAAGLTQLVRGSKYDRRKDLRGFHLKVASIETYLT